MIKNFEIHKFLIRYINKIHKFFFYNKIMLCNRGFNLNIEFVLIEKFNVYRDEKMTKTIDITTQQQNNVITEIVQASEGKKYFYLLLHDKT